MMSGEVLRLRRGQTVYVRYSPAEYLYRVDTGMLRLLRQTTKGCTVTMRHLLPGDYFGEEALMQLNHKEQVQSLTRSTIDRIKPQDLSAEELQLVVSSLSMQLSRAMQHEYNLQVGDLRQRVIRYLLDLANTPLGGENSNNQLYVRATHEFLAEGTFATRESVSKVITDLRAEGVVSTGYREIILQDLDYLQSCLQAVPNLKTSETPNSETSHSEIQSSA